MKKISDILKSHPYPGRGIIMGRSSCATKAVIAYFIMGRSDNSRNRVFIQEGCCIKTKAYDENLISDPSLIIYNLAKQSRGLIIVTNGAQTDEIAVLMDKGLTFFQALQFIEFEPDAPYYTPRISAVMNMNDFNYQLSIVKTADGNPDSCNRFMYSYESAAGKGHFIHTYGNDDKSLASFSGEPLSIEIDDDIDTFTNTIWDSLNADNKVSLFTRFINLSDNKSESRIINKNE
jgi:IMP cyclohydrolase